MAGSLDGPECRHGVNAFDPRGCAACDAEFRRCGRNPVEVYISNPERRSWVEGRFIRMGAGMACAAQAKGTPK